MSSTQHSSRQEVCMPSIPAAHEARDLLISLNRQLGLIQVQGPKGYEPCDYPSTAPQHLSSRPQPLKLPLALAKPSNPSSGPCHNTSSAHAKPTPGPFQPTCCITPTAAPRQHYPKRRQEKLKFFYIGAAERRRRNQRMTDICTGKM
ncbi:hypothetical protein ACFX1R_027111 [Malus domestica]